MARKSHPGGAETYWGSDLDEARKERARLVGWLGRVVGVLGLGTHWDDASAKKLDEWLWDWSRAGSEFEDGGGI